MLAHVLAARRRRRRGSIAVVVGPGPRRRRAEARKAAPEARGFRADRAAGHGPCGAGRARGDRRADFDEFLMPFADTPLVAAGDFAALRAAARQARGIAALGFEPADPDRLWPRSSSATGVSLAIREHKDASASERADPPAATPARSASPAPRRWRLLEAIGADNAAGEFYLTDVVEIAAARGLPAQRAARGRAGGDGRQRPRATRRRRSGNAAAPARARRCAEGATLIAPETVFFSHDTKLGRDVVDRAACGVRARA